MGIFTIKPKEQSIKLISFIKRQKQLYYYILSFIQSQKPLYYKYEMPISTELEKFGHSIILTDEIEDDPIEPNNQFNFKDYCKAIISIINGSNKNCSIGIYGEWGTGKTTLMKLIQRELNPPIFCWDNIPSNNPNEPTPNDTVRLKNYLIKNFKGLEWILDKNIEFTKSNNGIALTINRFPLMVSIKLSKSNKAILQINYKNVSEFLIRQIESNDDSNKKKLVTYICESNVLTVWFNAWKYEKEEHFAILPLLKTIAYRMGEHPFYRNIKPILLRGIEILGKDLIRNISTKYLLTEQGMKEFEEKLIPKLERLSEIDKNTIYFDGLKKVEDEIKSIQTQFRPGRIVVFIDDLDRCSPETAVEIFESIKIFLDIEGFIFILGLSRDLLDKMIEIKLVKAGLKGIEADEYIRKIIQIEINIQKWNNDSIKRLITRLSFKLEEKDHIAIDNNLDLILKVVDQNPRLAKRYINNYIIASSAREKLIKSREYFLGELLNKKWPDFYKNLGADEKFRTDIQKYIQKPLPEILKEIKEEKKKYTDKIPEQFEKILKIGEPLWDFITNEKNISSFIEICNEWPTYESAVESVKTISTTQKSVTYDKFQYQSRIETIALLKEVVSGLSELKTLIDSNHLYIDEETKDKIMEGFSVLEYIQSSNAYSYANDLGRIMTILEKILRSIPMIISKNKEKLTKENEDWLSRYQRRLNNQVINDLYEINHIA